MGLSVYHTSHELLREMLREVLLDAVEAGPGMRTGIGSVPCRASAMLYALLADHPIDRRGRCRSCRRPGVMLLGRRRRCRIYIEASYWLRHPDEGLLTHLASELSREGWLRTTPAAEPDDTEPDDTDDTDVLPRVAVDPGDPGTSPQETLAVSASPPRRASPQARRSALGQGEAGARLENPLPPRVSPGKQRPELSVVTSA